MEPPLPMLPFSPDDWYAFAGASKGPANEEPLIYHFSPNEMRAFGNEIDYACIIVDFCDGWGCTITAGDEQSHVWYHTFNLIPSRDEAIALATGFAGCPTAAAQVINLLGDGP